MEWRSEAPRFIATRRNNKYSDTWIVYKEFVQDLLYSIPKYTTYILTAPNAIHMSMTHPGIPHIHDMSLSRMQRLQKCMYYRVYDHQLIAAAHP